MPEFVVFSWCHLNLLLGWKKCLILCLLTTKNFFYIFLFLVALFWELLKPILATSTNNLAFLSFYTVPDATVQAEMIEQHS